MSQHEIKSCPRCSKLFECKPGNITQCQCYGPTLSAEQQAYIEQRYNDCLCHECLLYLSDELNLFKEKYIFR
ncbi:MAG: cysteine-rich CWC family protein [Sphingobacteriales bacterium]|nr:cysteine-rich CWC family protein [Sphingobacteriales bacterium]